MKIISRKNEMRELERCERSDKSELVCVYGRRRVGKTYLVEQTFSNYFAFRAAGVEGGNTRTQLKAFHQRLLACGDQVRHIPSNWFEAFSRLEILLRGEMIRKSPHGKIIVFLDEFPWFATARSDFLMAFGDFWNRCGTAGGDYLFIICGSATSWIIGNILENTGSLYNRVTCQIFLPPFTLRETELFFRDHEFGWSRRQIAECQMVFGGLPYFLSLLNPDESLIWNIDRLCFSSNALLAQESKKLLEATLKHSPIYNLILELLSEKQYGMQKAVCRDILGIPQGTFTRAVDDLVKCGYIQEYKDKYTQGRPLCLRLVDPFLLFHYRFLSGRHPESAETFEDYRADTGRYNNWRGHSFEILCLSHVDTIKKALGISGVRTSNFSWVSEKKTGGAQIDLVIERDDGITNVCEAKFTDTPFSISAEYERNLLHKVQVFREESNTRAALKLVMICSEGISGKAHTEHISRVLTLDDLFE